MAAIKPFFLSLLQEALEALNAKKQQLREAQERLHAINDSLQQKKQRKAELENEVMD